MVRVVIRVGDLGLGSPACGRHRGGCAQPLAAGGRLGRGLWQDFMQRKPAQRLQGLSGYMTLQTPPGRPRPLLCAQPSPTHLSASTYWNHCTHVRENQGGGRDCGQYGPGRKREGARLGEHRPSTGEGAGHATLARSAKAQRVKRDAARHVTALRPQRSSCTLQIRI